MHKDLESILVGEQELNDIVKTLAADIDRDYGD